MRGNKWTCADRTSIGPGPAPARDRAEHRTCAPNGTALARVRPGRALVRRGSPPQRCPRGTGAGGVVAAGGLRRAGDPAAEPAQTGCCGSSRVANGTGRFAVLAPAEPLLLGGDDDLAVHDQRGSRVVISGVDAEHPQVIARRTSRQPAVAWQTVAERQSGRSRWRGDAWRTQRSGTGAWTTFGSSRRPAVGPRCGWAPMPPPRKPRTGGSGWRRATRPGTPRTPTRLATEPVTAPSATGRPPAASAPAPVRPA